MKAAASRSKPAAAKPAIERRAPVPPRGDETQETPSNLAGWLRRYRLATGLTMFSFVFLHLTNHSFGLIGISFMEAAQPYMVGLFRLGWLSLVFATAASSHLALGFWSLYLRRNLRMPIWEAMQLSLGLLIPVFLTHHLVEVRISMLLYGTELNYSYVVWQFLDHPFQILRQISLLIIAWSHGCIGIHFWLRFRPWYPRGRIVLFAGALLMPVLALTGFLAASREIAALDIQPREHRAFVANANIPGPEGEEFLRALEHDLYYALAGTLALTLIARYIRDRPGKTLGQISVTYNDGRVVMTAPGPTVLEISRSADIPHASVCGGRSRCSTCRVRVGGNARLPPPAADEARILERFGAASDVRLACQIRPTTDISVFPLFQFPVDTEHQRRFDTGKAAREKDIVVLFADLRDFTRISESKLPYDTVFLLNRYFAGMGKAVEESGGYLDKFVGDGVMALFGLDKPLPQSGRDALRAAKAMSFQLAEINKEFSDYGETLRIGIGVHAGPVITGDMGWGTALSLTAIGDTVNTASRVEELTKRFKVELVIADSLSTLCGIPLDGFEKHTVAVRGRASELTIRTVKNAQDLPDF
jgi:adenylate cyclase